MKNEFKLIFILHKVVLTIFIQSLEQRLLSKQSIWTRLAFPGEILGSLEGP